MGHNVCMPASTRPRIGIPVRLSSPDGNDVRVGKAHRLFAHIVDLVRDAGAEPVPLKGPADVGLLTDELAKFDGVLLPGGGDVDPRLYGQTPVETCYDVNPEQDALDLAVVRAALANDLPVLGVCRGHQLINVAYGGTLVQDMPPTSVAHRKPAPASNDPAAVEYQAGGPSSWAWHPVDLAQGSRIAGLYADGSKGPRSLTVASAHHQAVDDIGPGLTVTGVAPDGTVEALEDPDRWLVTMQWHPEAALVPEEERREPFAAFVRVCRDRMQSPRR